MYLTNNYYIARLLLTLHHPGDSSSTTQAPSVVCTLGILLNTNTTVSLLVLCISATLIRDTRYISVFNGLSRAPGQVDRKLIPGFGARVVQLQRKANTKYESVQGIYE